MKEDNKYYIGNYGLIGLIGLLRGIDIWQTYKAKELDDNFIEKNLLMAKIVNNKPLAIGLNTGYVGALGVGNYLVNKASNHYQRPEINKMTTGSLVLNVLINLYVVGLNYKTLRDIQEKINV